MRRRQFPEMTEKESNCYLLKSGPSSAALNMATDEALLESAESRGCPVLRFYSWTEPAASFGYFQRFGDVARITHLRPLVRRPTGGGVVPHEADWTYSLVFPPSHCWYRLKAMESYRQLHEWLQESFKRCSLSTELAAIRNKERPGECFAGSEQFDLLRAGRKMGGAAQRRNRHGLLIQGSIQPVPAEIGRRQWEDALCRAAEGKWGIRLETFQPDAQLRNRVTELAAGKYLRRDYNERR